MICQVTDIWNLLEVLEIRPDKGVRRPPVHRQIFLSQAPVSSHKDNSEYIQHIYIEKRLKFQFPFIFFFHIQLTGI